MGKDDSTNSTGLSDLPHERKEPRPDFTEPLPRQTLSRALQHQLDAAEPDVWSSVYSGTAPESTESSIRYAGYAARVKTVLLSASRYVAYTSDIGESFRPVAHPYLVKGAYGVSWAYLIGDVGHEGYKAWVRNQRVLHPHLYKDEISAQPDHSVTGQVKEAVAEVKGVVEAAKTQMTGGPPGDVAGTTTPGRVIPLEDYRTVMAQRAIFQGLASMGLPALTIHSIVKYSGRAMKDLKNVKIRTWAPIGLGLSFVPALPYCFDEPVEHATEWVFHKGFQFFGGPEAVGHRPETGREKLLQQEAKSQVAREKEL